jgi:hypothetical protein
MIHVEGLDENPDGLGLGIVHADSESSGQWDSLGGLPGTPLEGRRWEWAGRHRDQTTTEHSAQETHPGQTHVRVASPRDSWRSERWMGRSSGCDNNNRALGPGSTSRSNTCSGGVSTRFVALRAMDGPIEWVRYSCETSTSGPITRGLRKPMILRMPTSSLWLSECVRANNHRTNPRRNEMKHLPRPRGRETRERKGPEGGRASGPLR